MQEGSHSNHIDIYATSLSHKSSFLTFVSATSIPPTKPTTSDMQIPSASPIIAALQRASSQNTNSQPSSPTPPQTLAIQNPSHMHSLLCIEQASDNATLTPRVRKRALQQVVPKRDRKVVVKWMQAQVESSVPVRGLMARAVRHFRPFSLEMRRQMSLKR